jgi:hypothetical protein
VSEIKDDLKDLGERMKADMRKGRNKTHAKNQDQLTEQKMAIKKQLSMSPIQLSNLLPPKFLLMKYKQNKIE